MIALPGRSAGWHGCSEAGANPALSRNCDALRGRARSPAPCYRFESSQEGLIMVSITSHESRREGVREYP
jgi:hypothetical protein